MGAKTKNDCAGEGQQQITALLCSAYHAVYIDISTAVCYYSYIYKHT
jgi:hypothetical protein